MYQLTQRDSVIRIFDGAIIPCAPGNMCFISYQKWLDDGNVPNHFIGQVSKPNFVSRFKVRAAQWGSRND